MEAKNRDEKYRLNFATKSKLLQRENEFGI
jgi:hypothetical protein